MDPKICRSSGTLTLLSATALAALLAGSAGLTPALAADLGGNCCADLEERVAELEATSARKGNRRVSLTITGQVSTALMAWNDGSDEVLAPDGKKDDKVLTKSGRGRGSDVYVVDNVPSGGTFFAFTGDAKINPKLTAGFNVTIALDTGGRSHQVSQIDDDGTRDPVRDAGARSAGGFDTDIVLTLANWYLDHKDLGRVTVGRINTATAGATTVDLGGAGVTANSQIGYTQRSFLLAINDVAFNSAGTTWAAALGGNTVNGAGLSRAQAISYTSPNFGGFSLSAAWGEDDVYDVALRYAGEASGFRFAAAIGYIHNSSGLGDASEEFDAAGFRQDLAKPTQVKGSASVLHVATGLYLTGAYVNQDNDAPVAGLDDNTTLWFVQGGVSKNWTGMGSTVIYGEYARVEDARVDFSAFFGAGNIVAAETDMWGLGIVQHVDAAAMELFLSYRRFSAEQSGPLRVEVDGSTSFNDFDVVMGGARIKF
jgi:Gram-negative porin